MLAELDGHFGKVVQAVAECVDVHHGTAAHHQRLVPFCKKAVHEVDGLGLIDACRVVAGDGDAADEIVPDGGEFLI